MGKRTAAEADVVDYDYATTATTFRAMSNASANFRPTALPVDASGTDGSGGSSGRAGLRESPVPLKWWSIPDRDVEPRGACHTRVRAAARAKHLNLPFHATTAPRILPPDDDPEIGSHTDDDGDHMTELSMALPPLVAPRPRRVVSPDLIFQSHKTSHCVTATATTPMEAEDSQHEDSEALHALSQRCRAFRPIGAGRPDVEITSPPPRAMNPVVLDARFKNMQRLDLQLDARDAPLQPFHRPCPQRRRVPAATVVMFAKVAPLDVRGGEDDDATMPSKPA